MKVTKRVYPGGAAFYRNEHGFWHNEDGPAIIYSDGEEEYWLNGKEYSYEEWLSLTPNNISVKWREYWREYCRNNKINFIKRLWIKVKKWVL